MSTPDIDQDFRAFVRSFRLNEYKDVLLRLADHGLPTTAPDLITPTSTPDLVAQDEQSPFDVALLPAPAHLIGRDDDLKWLLGRLRQGSAAGVTALSGIGGIGKTALVAVAIRTMKDENRYPDGIVVILCQDEAEPVHVLRTLLGRFDPERRQPDATDIAGLAEIAQRLLAGKHALIVLDDVEPELAEHLTDVTSPLLSAGAVLLLTTRQQLSRDVVPATGILELELLPAKTACDLFAQSYGTPNLSLLELADHVAVERIVMALGRHTLAIKLAGAYAADQHRPLPVLAKELEEDPLRLPADAGEPAISFIFQKSVDQLSPDGKRLFPALSVFKTSQFGRGAVLVLAAALKVLEPEVTLALLAHRALLDPSFDDTMPEGSDRERLSMNPLLRALAAKQFIAWPSEDQQAANRAIAALYADYVVRIESMQLAETALQADAANILGALEWAIGNNEPELTANLCYGMRNYWLNRWYTKDVLHYMSWSVKAANEAAGMTLDAEAVRRLADVALTYGRVVRRTGELDVAKEIFESNLAIRRRIADRAGEAAVLHQLGRVEQTQGRLEEAERFFSQSLNIFDDIGDRRNVATNIGGLGRVAQARGRLKEAERFFIESLQIARGAHDRRGEAAILSSLAQVGLARGTYEEAERYLRQSLQIRREISDEQGVSEVLSQLGRLALDRGDFLQAEQHLKESLQINQKVLDRPNAGVDQSQLALVALEAGQLDEAEGYLGQSLAIRREVHDPRGEGVDLALLGRIALIRGRLAEAEKYYTQSLELARKVQNRRGEGVDLRQLALIYEQLKEYDRAEENYRLALEIGQEVDNGLDIADSLLAFGRFLVVQLHDRARGCPMLQEAVARYARMRVPGEQIARDTARRHGCLS